MTYLRRYYQSAFWFTSFELIIVMIIMWLAFLMLQWVFKPSNNDQLYGEVCINTIFWELQKYSINALTAKSVLFANQKYFPQRYTATIDSFSNSIILWFETETLSGSLKTLSLSGSQAIKHCHNNSYQVIITGSSSTLMFSKNYQTTLTQPSWLRDRGLTWDILIQLCNTSSNQICKDFYKIAIDTRVQRLILISCAQRSSPERCGIWRE